MSYKDEFWRFIRRILDIISTIYGLLFWPSQKAKLESITDPILLKSAVEIADGIRKGELKAEDVMRSYIKRGLAVNPQINAIIDNRFDDAIKDAIEVDKKVQQELNGEASGDGHRVIDLPLLGVPFSVKDSISVKGLKLTAGLIYRKNEVAAEDAEAVSNLRKAGAIPIVITNVPETLLWYDADNKLFGRTNNPYDLSRIPGGSSGGEAALIAAAGSVIGLGTDIGGSIRIPCAYSGIFGHKTTGEIVPDAGKWPPITLDRRKFFTFGPMCRYAKDLIPMLKAMTGKNIEKLPKIDQPVDFSKITIYYSLDDEDPFKTRVDDELQRKILDTTDHFASKYNSKIRKIKLEKLKFAVKYWSASMKQLGPPHILDTMAGPSGQINVFLELIKCVFNKSDHAFGPLAIAAFMKFGTLFTKNTMAVVEEAEAFKKEFSELLGEDKIFLYPLSPEVAVKHGTTILKSGNLGYSTIMNILGVPVTQCPVGLNKDNLPLGFQVVAGPYQDHLCLNAALEIERLFGGWVPPTAISLIN